MIRAAIELGTRKLGTYNRNAFSIGVQPILKARSKIMARIVII